MSILFVDFTMSPKHMKIKCCFHGPQREWKWFSEFLEIRVFFLQLTLHTKMKFSINDFFSKCDQIRKKLRI